MKKIFFAAMAFGLLTVSSCKKSSSSGPASWTFKSVNYTANSCNSQGGGILEASNATLNNLLTAASVDVTFYGGTLPTASGVDTIVQYASRSTQVEISATINGTSGYSATGGNGVQTVNVTVASNGKVTVKNNAPIMMVSFASSADSSALTNLNMTQQ